MFTFYRSWSKPAEIWKILLAEHVLPDAEQRFGKPLHFFPPPDAPLWHEVGLLVAIPDGDRIAIVLACKSSLMEEEEHLLYREMELLLGKQTWEFASAKAAGWFLHDVLKD